MSKIKANIKEIFRAIKNHSSDPVTVKLVAVSKNRSVKEIEEAIQSGISIIGENRIQGAGKKLPLLKVPVEKHFIGHLQSNKVKQAVALFDLIQSVDSLKLAEKINTEAEKNGKIIPILLQINVSRDPAKFGFKPEEVISVLKDMTKFTHIQVQGLMTIGKLTNNKNETRACFRQFRQLFEHIKQAKISGIDMKYLSMGMSDDYEIALEEGSNMIRLGRKIFE